MRASAFLSSTALLLAIHGNAIAANRCNAFMSNMTGGELYVARDNCNSFKCLQQVVSNLFSEYSSINLKSNTNYSFYYKTTETMVTNSVVAVQIKHLGVEKHADAKRDETPFACSAQERQSYRLADFRGNDAAIDYDVYDRYHR